jgi:hypothetical protein
MAVLDQLVLSSGRFRMVGALYGGHPATQMVIASANLATTIFALPEGLHDRPHMLSPRYLNLTYLF